jgi:hypothetical protein
MGISCGYGRLLEEGAVRGCAGGGMGGAVTVGGFSLLGSYYRYHLLTPRSSYHHIPYQPPARQRNHPSDPGNSPTLTAMVESHESNPFPLFFNIVILLESACFWGGGDTIFIGGGVGLGWEGLNRSSLLKIK